MTSTDKPGIVAKVEHMVTGLWWPEADEGALRRAADAYRAAARALLDARSTATIAAGDAQAAASGPAADAFEHFWSSRYTGGNGAFTTAVAGCQAMATALDRYANEVARAKTEIIHRIEEVGATLAVGVVLTVFTFGASDAIAGAVAAGLVAMTGAAESALAVAGITIFSEVLAGALAGSVASGSTDLVVQGLKMGVFHDQKHIDFGEVGDSVVSGAEAGGAASGIVGVAGRLYTTMPDLAAANPALARMLAGAPPYLDSLAGKAVLGLATAAGGDLAATGKLSPLDLVVGTVGGAIGPDALPGAQRARLARGLSFADHQTEGLSFTDVHLANGSVLPGYEPGYEIIATRNTQLAQVSESSALGYLRDFDARYRRGQIIATTPSTVESGLAGQALAGRPVLVVPVQARPVPLAVLQKAAELGISIRDTSGRLYTLAHPGGA